MNHAVCRGLENVTTSKTSIVIAGNLNPKPPSCSLLGFHVRMEKGNLGHAMFVWRKASLDMLIHAWLGKGARLVPEPQK